MMIVFLSSCEAEVTPLSLQFLSAHVQKKEKSQYLASLVLVRSLGLCESGISNVVGLAPLQFPVE